MKTIEEIRHARLLELLESGEYPTLQALADVLERKQAQVSQWKNRSKRTGGGTCNIDNDSARHIERMTGRPRGWMDNLRPTDAYGEPQAHTGLGSPTSMGQTVAEWVDALPEEKRLKAFWLLHQMCKADIWPELSYPAPAASPDPLPVPIVAPVPSERP